MKLLLAFLLVTAVLAEQQSTLPVEEVNSNAFEFVKGFLEGIGEKGDINKLLHCIKDLEHIFAEIKEALEYLKKMKLPDIIHGLTLLFNAVREFVGMLKPCTEGFEVLKHLISEMIHPNIRKIAMHIIMHPGKFIHDITEAIACFGKHDYHCAGKSVGALLKLMFLSRMEEDDGNSAYDFLKGFLEGIGEHGDINKLLKCLKDLEHIFQEIKHALEYLKHMNLENLIKGLTLLFSAVREFMNMLKPCSDGFDKIKKLISAIAHPNIRKIAMHIVMHPTKFLHEITGAIGCFGKHDYHCAGRHVGGLLKIMFL